MLVMAILCLAPPTSITFLIQYLQPDTPAVLLFFSFMLVLLASYRLVGVLVIDTCCNYPVLSTAAPQQGLAPVIMPFWMVHASLTREMREYDLEFEEAGVRRDAESDEEYSEAGSDMDSVFDYLQYGTLVAE